MSAIWPHNKREPWRFASGRSVVFFLLVLILATVVLSGCSSLNGNDEVSDDIDKTSWFSIKMSIMTTCVQFLLVVAIVLLYHKMNQLVAKMNEISQDASKFLRMGMTYFKKK